MNLEKVFEFIKEKRGYDTPFKYRLVNGLPLSEDELHTNGYLDLSERNIKSLPDNLKVGGSLFLSETKITSLPDNLHVGRSLDLDNTKIKSLPNNLKVGRNLFVNNTPISKKYYNIQIIKMIEDKGGFVKGQIL